MLSMEREETRGSSSRGMCNFKRLSRSINLAFEAFPRLFLASITVILPLLAAAATRVVVVVYYHVSTFWLSPKKGPQLSLTFKATIAIILYIFFVLMYVKKPQRQVNIHVFFASHVNIVNIDLKC